MTNTIRNNQLSYNSIYVACLASYNNGILHGTWINLDGLEESDVWQEIDKILDSSPELGAEEWFVADYELEGDIDFGEYPCIAEIIKYVELIEEYDADLFSKIYNYGYSFDETIQKLENDFIGIYDSLEDYAMETVDLSAVPEHLHYYFDFDALAKDAENSGDITSFELRNGDIAVFIGS